MTTNEIQKLRRSALLAIKAYFSLSLTKGWEDTLEGRQMQAAYFMHQAACLDLVTPEASEMSPRIRAIVLDVVETMEESLEDDSTNKNMVRACLRKLNQLLGEPAEKDLDQGGAAAGPPNG